MEMRSARLDGRIDAVDLLGKVFVSAWMKSEVDLLVMLNGWLGRRKV